MCPAYDDLASDGSFSAVADREHELDVLAMYRRATHGAASLLSWLGVRTGCWVGLLDRSTGRVLVETTTPVLDAGALSLVGQALKEMSERHLSTFVAGDEVGCRAVLVGVDDPAGGDGLVLATYGTGTAPASLVADASVIVAMRWSGEQARKRQADLEITEARCREAVLHLLMSRQLSVAGQVASTLTPELPDPVRVYVIDPTTQQRAVALRCLAELTEDKAWPVPCPVHVGHIIVLAPPSAGPGSQPLEAALAAEVGEGCAVGAGDVVALRDLSVGYQQAFHALAVAQGRPERVARFDATLDPPTVLGPAGAAWAAAFLTPLIDFVPRHNGIPDAAVLLATARSWLSFALGATHHLKIHQNTLYRRLSRIERLLGLDLHRIDHQATLDLALRIKAAPPRADSSTPPPAADNPHLEDLLRLPEMREWACAMLSPVRDADTRRRRPPRSFGYEQTLRTWLTCGCKLSVTAEILGIEEQTARKRLSRLEQILQRSLLQFPSARYDLWLAQSATADTHQEVTDGEARRRETILNLLTGRQLSVSDHVSQAKLAELPDPMKVYLIDSSPERHQMLRRHLANLTGDQAWAMPCPAHPRRMIALASPDAGPRSQPLEDALASGVGNGGAVGAGDLVTLHDLPVGYEQALHALTAARGRPEQSARFEALPDLPTALGPFGVAWAHRQLTPLRDYRPSRAGDPDSREMTATAHSWLLFSIDDAPRYLNIHRSTLQDRLRILASTLGLDLARIDHQATLNLALRITATSLGDQPDAAHLAEANLDLDGLLRLPAARKWADITLRIVHRAAQNEQDEELEGAVLTWLRKDTNMRATAEALQLSVHGVRKRLARLEHLLQRSLLHSPNARYGLWLAVHAADLTDHKE